MLCKDILEAWCSNATKSTPTPTRFSIYFFAFLHVPLQESLEEQHDLRCRSAIATQRTLQAVANQALAEQVVRVHEYRKAWMCHYGFDEHDVRTELAWETQFRNLNTGMDWTEFQVPLFLNSFLCASSNLVLPRPLLQALVPICNLAAQYRRLLLVNAPLASLAPFRSRLANRIEESEVEAGYWQARGRNRSTLQFTINNNTIVI